MKLGFHGATTMTADLQTDVAASAHAGFKGLEVWWPSHRLPVCFGGSQPNPHLGDKQGIGERSFSGKDTVSDETL